MPLGVTAAAVNALSGGTFTQAQVDAAAGMLEGLLGWHVAPSVSETLKLYSSGAPTLVLPSLKVGTVTSVTTVESSEVMDGWYLAGQKNDLQVLERRWSAWPRGWYSVVLTHGYASTPSDLLWAVEAACQLVSLGVLAAGTALSIDDFSTKVQTNPQEVALITTAVERHGLPQAG